MPPPATAPVAAAPAALTSGLDKPGMDAAVRPQDSLFSAMNGTWLKNTPIPGDKSDYGTFMQLDDLSNERVKAIIEGLAAKPQAAGTINAKIGDFYTSYMDTAAIDAAGMRRCGRTWRRSTPSRPRTTWCADGPSGRLRRPADGPGRRPRRQGSDRLLRRRRPGRPGHGRPRLLPEEGRALRQGAQGLRRYMRQLLAVAGQQERQGPGLRRHEPGDEAREDPVDAGGQPRPGQDLQPDDARRSSRPRRPTSTGRPSSPRATWPMRRSSRSRSRATSGRWASWSSPSRWTSGRPTCACT